MRRPMEVGTSMLPDFFGAALDAAGAAAACTSDARISPLALEPRTVAITTPNSFARRLALGEILALWAADVWGAFGVTGVACVSVFALAAGAADSFLVGGF